MQSKHTTRRAFLRRCALLGLGSLTAACGGTPPLAPSVAPTVVVADTQATMLPAAATATPLPASASGGRTAARAVPSPGARRFSDIGSREQLIANAQAEGSLVVSGLPHDWVNYDLILDAFTNLYGIPVTELTPSASSAEVLGQLAGTPGAPDAAVPDVVDLVASAGQRAVEQHLLQPYEHAHWLDVPATLRHPDALWSSAYQGLIALAVNKAAVAVVPKQWKDLLSSAYRGQYALPGDPKTSPLALHSVYAASLADASTLDDGTAALAFYAQLHAAQTLLPVVATTASFLSGDTPIMPVWSYTAYALRAQAGSNPPVEFTIPTPSLAGPFVHGINAYAAHPFAARLWIEHLFSDDVQMRFATAYALPSRIDTLATNATYAALLEPLGFSAALRAGVVVPRAEQLRSAAALFSTQWDATVADPVTP